jgi:hypothetical protein
MGCSKRTQRKASAMAVYTVHEPPLKGSETQPDPERFAFVRDGFSFWAFLLPPLWMLRHRLWLVFLGYLVVLVALQLALNAIGASMTVKFLVSALLSLLVGLEAATLRRFTLRRWKNVGIVVGDDLEAAERRFYSAWSEDDWATNASIHHPPRTSSLSSASATTATSLFQPPPGSAGVIGLFPEPGASR